MKLRKFKARIGNSRTYPLYIGNDGITQRHTESSPLEHVIWNCRRFYKMNCSPTSPRAGIEVRIEEYNEKGELLEKFIPDGVFPFRFKRAEPLPSWVEMSLATFQGFLYSIYSHLILRSNLSIPQIDEVLNSYSYLAANGVVHVRTFDEACKLKLKSVSTDVTYHHLEFDYPETWNELNLRKISEIIDEENVIEGYYFAS